MPCPTKFDLFALDNASLRNKMRNMTRREFLCGNFGVFGAALLSSTVRLPAPESNDQVVMTVRGPRSPEALGSVLPHEHVILDTAGAERVKDSQYDRDDVVKVVKPYLQAAQEAGCRTLVECTPNYIGRDPILLRRLSKATGLHILTNTGLYGAANDQFVPGFAYEETPEQLADRWVTEAGRGIGDSGIRPGFIKIGVDNGRLSKIDRKLVEAAAQTHLETGLTIAAHTGDAEAAFHELDVLKKAGVSPNAFIWVHAQHEDDPKVLAEAAEQGAWISLDHIEKKSVDKYLALVNGLDKRGFLDRVLLSHDAGWYSIGEPGGGDYRGYTDMFEHFLPQLRDAGYSEAQVDQLTNINPRQAFVIR